ncbi:hypothetical protein VNI00_016041 [Paramarasmius palmivorus]|uniref:Uncharacterized protein n=1 Tax=Paramarasmius palmivorus TaxID=297713 RepID=A0AAW0BGN5_9AGAR
MDDLDKAQKKKKAAKHARATAKRRKQSGAIPLPGTGESTQLISWIWEAAGCLSGLSTAQALQDGLRVEYCKVYARVCRWHKVLLLQEEMQHCLASLVWEEKWWKERADIPGFTPAHSEGRSAYAHQRAAIKQRIAQRFTVKWNKTKAKAARPYIPLIPTTSTVAAHASSSKNAASSSKRKRDTLSDADDNDESDTDSTDSDYTDSGINDDDNDSSSAEESPTDDSGDEDEPQENLGNKQDEDEDKDEDKGEDESEEEELDITLSDRLMVMEGDDDNCKSRCDNCHLLLQKSYMPDPDLDEEEEEEEEDDLEGLDEEEPEEVPEPSPEDELLPLPESKLVPEFEPEVWAVPFTHPFSPRQAQ